MDVLVHRIEVVEVLKCQREEQRSLNMRFLVSFLTTSLITLTTSIHDFNELQYDENQHLLKNILLYSDSKTCQTTISNAWSRDNPYSSIRDLIPIDVSLISSFTDKNVSCFYTCIGQGTAKDLIQYPLPSEMYTGDTTLREFISKCKQAEVGFISYHPTPVKLFWINLQTQESVHLDTITKGEANMRWHSSYLGHKFEVRDEQTNELLKTHIVEFNGVVVVGDAGHGTLPTPVHESNIQNAMKNEWTRCNRVKRTFTELGFAKGKLPKDVWASISTYNYNNKNNAAREEWDRKGYFVNWWEVTPYLLGMPWGLKKYWQGRLMELVEKWIGGIPLELTDIYGIRRYEDGARLLTHVDREATHATSLIINVDQVDMREDWMVEIYDFAGRLHEIPMEPGDIVYYESARCLHGRMKPLRGKSYSNLFAHYRPIGDPEWYLKENPPSAPKQLIETGKCDPIPNTRGGLRCEAGSLPFLAPSREVVKGSDDLFDYWKRTGPNVMPERSETHHTEL